MAKSKRASDTPKHELYLYVWEDRERSGYSSEYFHLRGRFVTQKYEHSQWTPSGVDDDYSDGLLWSGLRASCQGDERSRQRTDENAGESGPVYGFDCEYHDVYRLDLRRVRRMQKTLEKVEKGLAKLREARGYVRSFGEYCGRLAEVMGCKGVVIAKGERQRTTTGLGWDWVSIGDGVNRVNHLIHVWVEEGKPQAEQEALPAASMREGADLLAAASDDEVTS